MDEHAWSELAAAVQGSVSRPDDPGYAAATPWNRSVTVAPAAVVSVASAADVAATIRWAGANGLRVAVQRTGHGALPYRDDVVLLDTTALADLRVDPAARTATVGAGVLASEVVAAAAEHGLAPLGGSAGGVSFVGWLSGGGIGPMSRTLGVGTDRVRAIEVVTGDGTPRRATPTENADLFWGLRGGKATLGIVTSVEVDLLPLTEFFGGGVFFAADDVGPVLRAWRPWAERLPAEATTSVCVAQLPDAPGVPAPLAGATTLAVRFVWLGPADEGRALTAPLLTAATPVLGEFGPMPAAAVFAVHNDPVDPVPSQEYGCLLEEFPAAAVEEFLRTAGPGSDSPLAMAEVRQLGGRVAADPPHPDAMSGRRAPYTLQLIGVPVPDSTAADAAADRIVAALRPWASDRALVNFVRTDDATRCYDPATLTRLRAVAERYDPDHVLHVGQVARDGVS